MHSFTHMMGTTLQFGIIASTGFVDGASTEYFFDDDGNGNLRIYFLVVGVSY